MIDAIATTPVSPKPRVNIIAATERDPFRAAGLLIFTKQTRLAMSPKGLDGTVQRCMAEPEWMMEQLGYMAKTIRSSWEFLDVTFMVENVSRACAQQMTRTRQASYAMQSQRVTDMSGVTFHIPETVQDKMEYEAALYDTLSNYKAAVERGESLEDARGLLAINAQCNLVTKYNLRTLADLLPARTSYRAQGEYNVVAAQMKAAVIQMWPWAELFFQPRSEIANSLLDELMAAIDNGATPHELKILASKAKDSINGGDK